MSGILARAVRGCLNWQKKGLGEPAEVITATEAYRKEAQKSAIRTPKQGARCC